MDDKGIALDTMTELDRDILNDRVTTIDDERKRIVDLYAMRITPPSVGIFDEPTRCYTLNKQWAKIVMGMVAHLTSIAAWHEAQEDDYDGINEIAKFMEGVDCDEACNIEVLLEDDDFFNNEYVPMTFGDWYANTIEHNEALNDAYDGTPQSIGENIPAGAPSDEQDNALCYALQSFVSLYASVKVCILQSRNFAQVAWDELRAAVNAVYNLFVDVLGYIYTPNLYSCFVDDTQAITVLQDQAAIQELACFLFDELATVAMTDDNFNDAIEAATTEMSLSDNARAIACIFHNDNNLTVYLNFLEAYSIALNRILEGDTLECPCVDGDYRILVHDFSTGLGEWRVVYFGQIPQGEIIGGRLTGRDIGDVKAIQLNWTGIDPTWRIRGIKVYYERVDGIGSGADDTVSFRVRPTPNSNSGATAIIASGFLSNGVLTICGSRHLISPFYVSNGLEYNLLLTVTDSATSAIYLDKIEMEFMTGFAPGGYPTDDGNICD